MKYRKNGHANEFRGDRTEDGDMIRWDREKQRVWVAGFRLHHGLTGAVLAVTGGLLMAHDWKDRYDWVIDHSNSRR